MVQYEDSNEITTNDNTILMRYRHNTIYIWRRNTMNTKINTWMGIIKYMNVSVSYKAIVKVI